jgi:hypothetical protein
MKEGTVAALTELARGNSMFMMKRVKGDLRAKDSRVTRLADGYRFQVNNSGQQQINFWTIP